MSVAALIPVRKRAPFLERCVLTLKGSNMPVSEILILASWLLPDTAARIRVLETVVDHVRVLWRDVDLATARRQLAEAAITEYIINLDADLEIPPNYLSFAVKVLKEHADVGAVTIDYAGPGPGHAAFGGSVWRRADMLRFYDPDLVQGQRRCECQVIFERLYESGLVVAAAPMAAEHKK